MPGSDVDLLLNRVLPQLAPGVLVHLHDIFLPDPYPPEWAWRGYNEQVAVACLLHGGGYALRFASHYLATRHAPRLAAGVIGELPLSPGAFESSLWLEKLALARGSLGVEERVGPVDAELGLRLPVEDAPSRARCAGLARARHRLQHVRRRVPIV